MKLKIAASRKVINKQIPCTSILLCAENCKFAYTLIDFFCEKKRDGEAEIERDLKSNWKAKWDADREGEYVCVCVGEISIQI